MMPLAVQLGLMVGWLGGLVAERIERTRAQSVGRVGLTCALAVNAAKYISLFTARAEIL